MSAIIAAIRAHAARTPAHTALCDETGHFDYRALDTEIASLAERLRAIAPRALAILGDNGRSWAVADLAALAADLPLVPLPSFFSPAQLAHTLRSAGIDVQFGCDTLLI